jgi:hypothetical protein
MSIATGSRSFVEEVKMKMGGFAVGRHVHKNSGNYELCETQSAYEVLLILFNIYWLTWFDPHFNG